MSARKTPESPLVCTNSLAPVSPAVTINLTHRFTGQVGKVLGERWKALSETQRKPYAAKADADKIRYEEEKANYNVSTAKCLSITVHTSTY
jgi:hypothetical protein